MWKDKFTALWKWNGKIKRHDYCFREEAEEKLDEIGHEICNESYILSEKKMSVHQEYQSMKKIVRYR